MHHPIDKIAHTTAFVTPVVKHWLEKEIAQWVHPMKDWSDDPLHMSERSYHGATSRSIQHQCSFVNQRLSAILFHVSAQSPNNSFSFCTTGIWQATTVSFLSGLKARLLSVLPLSKSDNVVITRQCFEATAENPPKTDEEKKETDKQYEKEKQKYVWKYVWLNMKSGKKRLWLIYDC